MIYAFLAVITLQNIIYHFERKDLYNRLMSRNLAEYKGEKCRFSPSAHAAVLKRWRKKDGENE